MQVRSKIFGALLAGAVAAGLNVAGGGLAPADAAVRAAQVTTPITPFAGVFHPISNVGNGMCLQPASTADTAAIVQEPCIPGSIAQGWQDRQIGTNHYNFINQQTGECIDAFDGAFNGARVLQTMCRGNVGNTNQQYNTAATLPNVVIIMSRVGGSDTGFCIDVPGAQAIAGLAMQLFSCNGTLAQRWVVGF
jgi:hypothetical protein